MNRRKLEIFKIFDEASQFLSAKDSKIKKDNVEGILSTIYSPGQSFQYIFDFNNRRFTYVSDSVFELFGVKSKEFEIDDFMERIHPEDINHFLRCEELAGYFLFSHIAKQEIPEYKISYQMRMKTRDGIYKLILHQAIAFTIDKDFKLGSTLANHSDISHITTSNNYKVSFINVREGKSYYNIGTKDDLSLASNISKILTQREIEILGCLSEGLSSKETAAHLFISEATVRTHRNNILKKTEFNTITQAVSYCVRNGML